MANKITLIYGLSWTDGSDIIKMAGTIPIDQVGHNVIEAIQNIDSEPVLVNIGDVTPGYVGFRNTSATATMTISSDNAAANIIAVLKPGQSVVLATSLTDIYAVSSVAGEPLLVLACDS